MPAMRSKTLKGRQRGFTIIELFITLVMVAILASISIAAYRGYVFRANRSEGTGALLRIQVAEEKFFLQNGTYTTSVTGAAGVGLSMGSTSSAPSGFYTLAIAAGTTGAIASSYAATATAVGVQLKDVAACQVLTIDDQGTRAPTTASGCWK
jgi:type IV pilus assembly protein PilE